MPRGRHRKPARAPQALVPALLVPGVLTLTAQSAGASTVAPSADTAAQPASQPAAAPQAQQPEAQQPQAQQPEAQQEEQAQQQEQAQPAPERQQPVRTRTWLGRSQTVTPGRPAVFTAAVADAAGNPVAGRKVVVYKKTSSGWRGNAAGYTGSDGRATVRVAVDRSATYGAGFAGDSAHAGSTTAHAVQVALQQTRVQQALRIAAAQRGKPYRYGSDGPNSFDCSGFVRYVMRQVGVSLPHNSRAQLDASREVSRSDLRVGDLVFTKRGSGIGHVGIYAGNGEWWVARRTGTTITKQKIYTSDVRVGRVL